MDYIAPVRFAGSNHLEVTLRRLLLGKGRIGIFGNGLSGQGVAALCQKHQLIYEIVDEKDGLLPHFDTYCCCVFSPGFPPSHSYWQQAKAHGLPCWNEIDFAAHFTNTPVIAITGTNGKTSTVQLITALLKNAGHSALAVGNNGQTFSKKLAESSCTDLTYFVCEISSFQAWSLRYLRPVCTLWINIAPDHLYYHGSYASYIEAKQQLLHQTQSLKICGHTLKPYIKDPTVHFSPPLEAMEKMLRDFPACFSQGQLENFALVQTFAQKWNINEGVLKKTMTEFAPPKHRLYCCHRSSNLEFWNDSKGTNLHAVQAALKSMSQKQSTAWILGGQDKGEDLNSFVETFNDYPSIEVIYLIGNTGAQLAQKAHLFHAKVIHCETLANVFRHLQQAPSIRTCVLSPGFASWDQFRSFEERGCQFETLARSFPSL